MKEKKEFKDIGRGGGGNRKCFGEVKWDYIFGRSLNILIRGGCRYWKE